MILPIVVVADLAVYYGLDYYCARQRKSARLESEVAKGFAGRMINMPRAVRYVSA